MKRIALACALVLGLAACGNSEPETVETESASPKVEQSTEATSEPTEEATETAEPTAAATPEVDSQGNPKASKEEFEQLLLAGATAALEEQGGADDPEVQAQIEESVQCVADYAYDKLSADALNAIINDPSAIPDEADLEILLAGAAKCQSAG